MKITLEFDNGVKKTFDNIVDYSFYDKDDILSYLYSGSEPGFDIDSFAKDADKVDDLCRMVAERAKACEAFPATDEFMGIVMECAEELGAV